MMPFWHWQRECPVRSTKNTVGDLECSGTCYTCNRPRCSQDVEPAAIPLPWYAKPVCASDAQKHADNEDAIKFVPIRHCVAKQRSSIFIPAAGSSQGTPEASSDVPKKCDNQEATKPEENEASLNISILSPGSLKRLLKFSQKDNNDDTGEIHQRFSKQRPSPLPIITADPDLDRFLMPPPAAPIKRFRKKEIPGHSLKTTYNCIHSQEEKQLPGRPKDPGIGILKMKMPLPSAGFQKCQKIDSAWSAEISTGGAFKRNHSSSTMNAADSELDKLQHKRQRD